MMSECSPVDVHARIEAGCSALAGCGSARFEGAADARGAHLEIEDLSCRFGGLAAIDGASLTVAPGEHVALVGPNGAGKSTLLRAILGLEPHARGRVAVDGCVARNCKDWDARRRLAPWIPQRPGTGRFPLLVDELLGSCGDHAAAVAYATGLGVAGFRRKPVHTLSGGQMQRCLLARAFGALANGGRILLADEPTAALDFAGRDTVAAMLRGVEASVLVATHDRAIAAQCDRVVEMASGRVRAWTS
jgi:zinc transport system ATP-binding protein